MKVLNAINAVIQAGIAGYDELFVVVSMVESWNPWLSLDIGSLCVLTNKIKAAGKPAARKVDINSHICNVEVEIQIIFWQGFSTAEEHLCND